MLCWVSDDCYAIVMRWSFGFVGCGLRDLSIRTRERDPLVLTSIYYLALYNDNIFALTIKSVFNFEIYCAVTEAYMQDFKI